MAKSVRREIISEGHLDFLEEMHRLGIELTVEQMGQLAKAGRISYKDTNLDIASEEDYYSKAENIDEHVKSQESFEADKHVLIVDNDAIEETGKTFFKKVTIADNETYDKLQESALFNYNNSKRIDKSDWMPKSLIDHELDFVLWINSINSGFQNMVKYDKFRKYCQQAKNWLDDPTNVLSFDTNDERRLYYHNEVKRCSVNTLYFLDKYLQLKEGDMKSGNMKYLSKPAHKVIAYLMDCGYSMMVGKGRQMAASSTFGGIALSKMLFQKNNFIKFIAQDDEKGKEIFNDKIKYPFGQLPGFMKPTVANDRDDVFRFAAKTSKKGTRGGVGSKLQVVPPSVGAINGGAPPLVMVDEAGYIGMLGKMLNESRPTMFRQNPETGKLEMTRQIVIWGTGGTEEGEVKRKTKSYEIEYYNCLDQWNKKNYNYGIIPIFFDWTARPGMTKKFYLQQQRDYQKDGAERESSMIQFRQHYPSSPQDMFLSTGKLLVDALWIHEQMERVRNVQPELQTKKGYFEPVYDTTRPTREGSDVPYEIIGATFVPVDENVEGNIASVEIFIDPNPLYRHRFYQGTDPIMSDNGYSNMASVIYDAHYNTLAAVLNFRASDHKYTFLQTMLLGLYYCPEKTKVGVPELVESNIGLAYINYKEERGFGRSLVHRKELPSAFSGGTAPIGLDTRSNRKRYVVNKMIELTVEFGPKIYIFEYFKQLETFTCTISSSGVEKWGVSDYKQFKDDVLDASAFSYICRQAFDFREVIKLTSENPLYKVQYKLVIRPDGTKGREAVKVPVYAT